MKKIYFCKPVTQYSPIKRKRWKHLFHAVSTQYKTEYSFIGTFGKSAKLTQLHNYTIGAGAGAPTF